MLCRLAAFAGYFFPFGHLPAPLAVWVVKGKTDPFADAQGKSALNFRISRTIDSFVAAFLLFVGIGLILFPLLVLFDVVRIVLAAYRGEFYAYKLSSRLIQ
jgi:uncharacterized Tic20 family protein